MFYTQSTGSHLKVVCWLLNLPASSLKAVYMSIYLCNTNSAYNDTAFLSFSECSKLEECVLMFVY